MMIPIYKIGGPHEFEGVEFSFKTVSKRDLSDYISNGWVKKKSDLHIEDAEFTEVKTKKNKKN